MRSKNRPRRGSAFAAEAERDFWDKFWHDKNGNLVVFRPPNALLITWAISFTLSQIIRSEPLQSIFSWLAFFALLIWAASEALFGVNYFRRILGGSILFLAVLVRF